MPQKHDEPLLVRQTVTAEDYAEASAAVAFFTAPMKRRTVRTLICVTAAAVAASFLPLCGGRVTARNAVIILAILGVVAGVAVWFLQPVFEKRRAVRWFRSCPLAALPAEVTLTRQSAVTVTECERLTEYWTDFSVCVETDRLIVAAGGRERFLLVLKKDGLEPEQKEKLSGLMRYVFDGRWGRVPSRKGGN